MQINISSYLQILTVNHNMRSLIVSPQHGCAANQARIGLSAFPLNHIIMTKDGLKRFLWRHTHTQTHSEKCCKYILEQNSMYHSRDKFPPLCGGFIVCWKKCLERKPRVISAWNKSLNTSHETVLALMLPLNYLHLCASLYLWWKSQRAHPFMLLGKIRENISEAKKTTL